MCITFEAWMSSYNFGSEVVISTVKTVNLVQFPAHYIFFSLLFLRDEVWKFALI